jgi:3-dehydroquinate synthase
MAEVVKTAIIGSPSLFESLARDLKTIEAMQRPDLLEACVMECARVKVSIVERDPYENGLRRVLNLGHTLGHAVEAVAGYGKVLHGEAVALGILAAIRVSLRRGIATRDFLAMTRAMFQACGLPVAMPVTDRDALAAAMGLDKKRRASGLTFVLPAAPGDIRLVDDVSPDEIFSAMAD